MATRVILKLHDDVIFEQEISASHTKDCFTVTVENVPESIENGFTKSGFSYTEDQLAQLCYSVPTEGRLEFVYRMTPTNWTHDDCKKWLDKKEISYE